MKKIIPQIHIKKLSGRISTKNWKVLGLFRANAFSRSVLWCLAVLLRIAASTVYAAESPAALNKSGNEAYMRNQYDLALEQYMKAKEQATEEIPELDFNIGSVFAKKGNYPKADEHFEKVLQTPGSDDIKPHTYYDKGVVSFRKAQQAEQTGDLESAISTLENAITYNKQALRHNPSDMDAKFNLEFARKKLQQLKEQQQQQQQNEQQQKDNQQKDEQSQQDQQQDKEQQQDQKDKEDQKQEDESRESREEEEKSPEQEPQSEQKPEQQEQQQEQDQPQPSDQERAEEQQTPQQTELSPEDVQRMLNALLEENPGDLKEFYRMRFRGVRDMERDW